MATETRMRSTTLMLPRTWRVTAEVALVTRNCDRLSRNATMDDAPMQSHRPTSCRVGSKIRWRMSEKRLTRETKKPITRSVTERCVCDSEAPCGS